MKDYKLKSGNILRVIQDDSAESPDTWSNEDIFLVYDDKQFFVRREGFEPKDIFEYLENCHEQIEDDRYDDYYIFVVYAIIHSGVSLSLTKGGEIWDVSTTGFILVRKFTDEEPEQDLLESKAREYAEGLLETWNQYLSGDVYGYRILKPIKTYKIHQHQFEAIEVIEPVNNIPMGLLYKENFLKLAEEKIEYEELNSCWGFYGEDPKENGMLEHIGDELLELDKEIYHSNEKSIFSAIQGGTDGG